MNVWFRYPYRALLPVAIVLGALLLAACGGKYPAPGKPGLTACFHNFTEIYQDRIYRVLKTAPGVDAVERLEPGDCGNAPGCLCYLLTCNRPVEELTSWLKQHLPINKTVPFHYVFRDSNHLDVIFDAGFR